MCGFRSNHGSAYDLYSLDRAQRELRDFLGTRIENPAFRTEAKDALTNVRHWLGEKHLKIADFYLRIGNTRGERYHLESAAISYPETAAGQQAAARIGTLAESVDPGGARR